MVEMRYASALLNAKESRLYLRIIYQSNKMRRCKLALIINLPTLMSYCPINNNVQSKLLLACEFNVSVWLVPSENTKTRKLHIVYLSKQSAVIFGELKTLAGQFEKLMARVVSD